MEYVFETWSLPSGQFKGEKNPQETAVNDQMLTKVLREEQ